MKFIKAGASLITFIALFIFLQTLFMPKYMDGVYEGSLIREYYEEEKNHQVIFLGDCEVYGNFSPITLWEEYGITSYIRGGPQQLIWQSYYILEDTLKYETPDIVVFNVLAMKFGEPQNEAYNRLNIDGLKFSIPKLKSAYASMTQDENLLSYALPLLRYHERWKELSSDDFKYLFDRKKVSFNGYMMRCDVKPVGIIPEGPKLPDYSFSDLSYEYLDKIRDLCEKNNIELILVKAPSIYPPWYDQWEDQMVTYAQENNLMYINFLNLFDETKIDLSTDTYNAGLHLNLYGAEKLSRYFGKVIKENYSLTDLRTDSKISESWHEKTKKYYEMMSQQEKEFAELGKIITKTY